MIRNFSMFFQILWAEIEIEIESENPEWKIVFVVFFFLFRTTILLKANKPFDENHLLMTLRITQDLIKTIFLLQRIIGWLRPRHSLVFITYLFTYIYLFCLRFSEFIIIRYLSKEFRSRLTTFYVSHISFCPFYAYRFCKRFHLSRLLLLLFFSFSSFSFIHRLCTTTPKIH